MQMQLTDLERLETAFNNATPGEWIEQHGLIYGDCDGDDDGSYLVCDLAGNDLAEENEQDQLNGNFIMLAHNLMPKLLAAVKLADNLDSFLRSIRSEELDGSEPSLGTLLDESKATLSALLAFPGNAQGEEQ